MRQHLTQGSDRSTRRTGTRLLIQAAHVVPHCVSAAVVVRCGDVSPRCCTPCGVSGRVRSQAGAVVSRRARPHVHVQDAVLQQHARPLRLHAGECSSAGLRWPRGRVAHIRDRTAALSRRLLSVPTCRCGCCSARSRQHEHVLAEVSRERHVRCLCSTLLTSSRASLYLSPCSFWSAGGPIFFYTGNEGAYVCLMWFCGDAVVVWCVVCCVLCVVCCVWCVVLSFKCVAVRCCHRTDGGVCCRSHRALRGGVYRALLPMSMRPVPTLAHVNGTCVLRCRTPASSGTSHRSLARCWCLRSTVTTARVCRLVRTRSRRHRP
jgi:hypothetical protein